MKINKSLIERALKKLRGNPGALFMVAGVCLLLIVYLASKQTPTKVITVQNPSSDFSTGRTISHNSDLYRLKDKTYTKKIRDLEDKLAQLTDKLDDLQEEGIKEKSATPTPAATTTTTHPSQPPGISPSRVQPPQIAPPVRDYPTTTIVSNDSGAMHKPTRRKPSGRASAPRKPRKAPAIISFPVKSKNKPPEMSVNLPSGSFVKAKLLTGIEAPEGKALPVLMQADYAFVGPNKSRVDLSGCFLIAKSTGNLSIERVEMQTTKISCVAKSGRSFERGLNGYIADGTDNSFAVIGEVNSKRDRVAAMAFLSSVVEGIGKAVSQAQTTTQSNDLGSTTTITGSQAKYIGASGASSAASTITSWYLKHAEGLLPTINVGSGQEVWVIVQEPVSLPNWYFKRHFDDFGGISFLNNFMQ